MNLWSESRKADRWLATVMGAFVRVRPWTTRTVIAMIAASRMARFLAFVLPLKVILLAGSSGVPRYFKGFVDPDEKSVAIGLLAGAAVAFYALSLLLDHFVDRFAMRGSRAVLAGANEIAVVNKQEDVTRDYYSQICQIYGHFIYVLAALSLGFFVNPWAFLFLVVIMAAEYMFTAAIIRGDQTPIHGTLRGQPRYNLGAYLGFFSNINFLLMFGFLLAGFLFFGFDNILIGILSILITRQSLGTTASLLADIVSTYRAQRQVNALVFPEHQLHRRENREKRILRERLVKPHRLEEVRRILETEGFPMAVHDVAWKDPTVQVASTFQVELEGSASNGRKNAQLQVYAPKNAKMLANEEHLFTFVERDALYAPRVLSRFTISPFECQLCEYGAATMLSAAEWKKWSVVLRDGIWAIQPPERLVSAYRLSKPLLADRFNEELLDRLDVAVDSREESDCLADAKKALPDIQGILRSQPLYIYNPDLNRKNVVSDSLGQSVRVMFWGRWALEPLGAGIPGKLRRKDAREAVNALVKSRHDLPAGFNIDSLYIAKECWDVEWLIDKGRYKAALHMLPAIYGRVSASISEANEMPQYRVETN